MRALFRLTVFLCVLALCCPLGATAAAKADKDKVEEDFEALRRFSQVLDLVNRYYVKDVNQGELLDGALKGMLQGLDPHSTFMTPEEHKEMQETTSGEFTGIGIEITVENGQVTVVTPIEDTPAYRAGLQSGDVILTINGQPTQELSLQDVVSRIRGPKGTEVELGILHSTSKSPKTIRVKREAIPLVSVKSKPLEDGYYWIRLTRFSGRTDEDLRDALKKATRECAKTGGLKGIVLDLRNNPGGLLDQAVSVSDMFLSKGTIVSIQGRGQGPGRGHRRARGGDHQRRFGLGLRDRGRCPARPEARPDHRRTLLRQGLGPEHHPPVRRLGPQADRGPVLYAQRQLHPGRGHRARPGDPLRAPA